MIPSKVNILGHTVNISYDDKRCNDASVYGLYFPIDKKIVLSKNFIKDDVVTPLSDDIIYHTYLHELVHAILDAMNEHKLYKDEKFIDVFSGILAQIKQTEEYETNEIKRKPRTTDTRRTVVNKSVRKINKKSKKKD
jgi:hypothetical protein